MKGFTQTEDIPFFAGEKVEFQVESSGPVDFTIKKGDGIILHKTVEGKLTDSFIVSDSKVVVPIYCFFELRPAAAYPTTVTLTVREKK